jgi:glutathione synthase/RimK-type ligase-like ATP-grasp enzyme
MGDLPTEVLLATCSQLPEGEPGAPALDRALADLGVAARWAVWDDPAVDWAAARVVAVRATWDYTERLEEFLGWARRVEAETQLLHGASLFAWNTDKQYLVELGAAGVPVVPTVSVDARDDLVAAAASFEGRTVVKPRVGAGGVGVVVVDEPDDLVEGDVGPGPWVVQPVVESVHREGELSVFVLGGQVTFQARKLPAGDEIRVHEEYGGRTIGVPLEEEAAALAKSCVDTTESMLGTTLHYARVDQMRMPSGELVVGELEATEPGLYLDVIPKNGPAFAAVLAALLGDHD